MPNDIIDAIESDVTALADTLPTFTDGRILTHSSEQTFKVCPRKFYLRYRLGIVPAYDGDALRIGAAFHVGLEQLKQGKGEDAAVAAVRAAYSGNDCPPYLDPFDFAVEQETVVALVRGYDRRYRNDAIVTYVAVEIPFDLPIVNPATGRETPTFRSAGKIDAIVELPDGRIALMEHKTTGESIEPGADYWKRLQLDAQISRYVLAGRAMGYDIQTTVYDVTRKPAIRPKAVAKMDRSMATSQGHYFGLALTAMCPERETPEMYGARLLADLIERPDFYFQRMEVPRLDDDLEEFRYEQWALQRTIRQAEIDGRFYRNTGACTAMFRCPYLDICRGMSGDPTQEIPTGFKRAERLHPELVANQGSDIP